MDSLVEKPSQAEEPRQGADTPEIDPAENADSDRENPTVEPQAAATTGDSPDAIPVLSDQQPADSASADVNDTDVDDIAETATEPSSKTGLETPESLAEETAAIPDELEEIEPVPEEDRDEGLSLDQDEESEIPESDRHAPESRADHPESANARPEDVDIHFHEESGGPQSSTQEMLVEGVFAGRDALFFQGDQKQDQSKEEGIFHPIEAREWAALESTFVPSADLKARLREWSDHPLEDRLVVVHGKRESGRWATALRLAVQLGFLNSETSRVMTFRRGSLSRPRLLDLMLREEPEDTTEKLWIVEDAFSGESSLRELQGADLSQLENALESRGVLILTSSLARRDFPPGLELVDATLGATERLSLMEKLLDASSIDTESRERVSQAWHRLAGILTTPFLVNRFVRQLARKQEISEASDLGALAREIVDPGPAVQRRWFEEELDTNDRLLAFFMLWFSGFSTKLVTILFLKTVRALQQSRIEDLKDPINLHLEDMLKRVRLVGERLKFESDHDRAFVESQIGNYRPLLFHLAELLLERLDLGGGTPVDDNRQDEKLVIGRQEARPESWRLRKGLGQLICQVGVFDESWRRVQLRLLAESEDWRRNTVASHVLEIMALRDLEQEGSEVLGILDEWSVADHRNLRWTAAAAAWRIFQLTADDSLSLAPKLVRRFRRRILSLLESQGHRLWGSRVRSQAWNQIQNDPKSRRNPKAALWGLLTGWQIGPVAYAVNRLLQSDGSDAATELASWMTSDKTLREIVTIGLLEALQQSPRKLLPALPALLSGRLASASAFSRKSEEIFKALASAAERPEIRDPLFEALWVTATRGDSVQRKRLRALLALHWSRSSKASDIVRSIIARSLVLEGRFAGFPTSGRILIVADPVLDRNPGGRAIIRYLEMVLGALGEIRRATLGSLGSRTESALQGRRKPRLLMPLIEDLGGEEFDCCIVLSAGSVLDLEDYVDFVAADDSILIGIGSAVPGEIELPALHFQGRVTEDRLQQLEDAVERRWSNNRRSLPAARSDRREARFEADLDRVAAELEAPVEKDAVDSLRSLLPVSEALAVSDSKTWEAAIESRLCAIETSARDTGSSWEFGTGHARGLVAAACALARLRSLGPILEDTNLSVETPGRIRHSLQQLENWLAQPTAWKAAANSESPAISEGSVGRLVRWISDQWSEVAPSAPVASRELHWDPLLSRQGSQRFVLVIDDGERNLRTVSARLVEDLSRSNDSYTPIVFKLGTVQPIVVDLAVEDTGPRATPLIGPILERPDLDPEDVAFVVVLSHARVLDLSDLKGSEWLEGLMIFGPKGRTYDTGIRSVPWGDPRPGNLIPLVKRWLSDAS